MFEYFFLSSKVEIKSPTIKEDSKIKPSLFSLSVTLKRISIKSPAFMFSGSSIFEILQFQNIQIQIFFENRPLQNFFYALLQYPQVYKGFLLSLSKHKVDNFLEALS